MSVDLLIQDRTSEEVIDRVGNQIKKEQEAEREQILWMGPDRPAQTIWQ
jgi:hypothetical protein